MEDFKATNRAEAGRKLAEIDQKLERYGSKFNIKKFVPLILCLEDAVNSLEIQVIKSAYVDKAFEKFPDVLVIFYQVITENFEFLNHILNEIVNDGFYDKSTKVELAETDFTIIIGEDFSQQLDQLIVKLQESGEVSKKPLVLGHRRLFNHRRLGAVCFIFSNTSKQTKCNLDRIMDYKDLLYQKGILESMIYRAPEGTEIKINEKGIEANYPKGFSVEHELEKVGVSPRTIENQRAACDWNSSFRTVANETAKTAKIEGKGNSNLARLDKENQELFNAYSSMPKFPVTFEQLYGVDIKSFCEIVDDLIMLSYYKTHTVGIWSLADLLKKWDAHNKVSNEQASKAINLLANKSEYSLHYRGVIILDEKLVLTNFRRLCNSKIALLENCFDEAYDKDLKGKVFEEACRKMLIEKKWTVLKSRLDILQPVLPEDISNKLFGKQKSKTDFDVVAASNNWLLVLECKEIKYSKTRLKVSEQNLFQKFSIEHFYRAKWISKNIQKLKEYMGHENWKLLGFIENQPIYILPMLVANTIVNIPSDEGTPIITFSELQERIGEKLIVRAKENEALEVEIKINGRTIVFPCFLGTQEN